MGKLLRWLIFFTIATMIFPVIFIMSVPISLVILCAEPYYDNKSSKGEIFYTAFKALIDIVKAVHKIVGLK